MKAFIESTFLTYFELGGFFMWPIFGVSLIAIFVAIERYLTLRFRYGIDGRQLFNQVKKYWAAKDSKRALETCRQYAYVPLAEVLAAGVAHADQPIDEMDTAMEAEAYQHIPRINDRLSYLPMLANIATLLGLLGTIAGLIASFAAVGSVDAAIPKGQALASGIAVAMYTTAFGLIVAIPTLFIHHFLSLKANRLIDDIQHYGTEFKKMIQRSRSQGGSVELSSHNKQESSEAASGASAEKLATA